jgi:hypothetical protein
MRNLTIAKILCTTAVAWSISATMAAPNGSTLKIDQLDSNSPQCENALLNPLTLAVSAALLRSPQLVGGQFAADKGASDM